MTRCYALYFIHPITREPYLNRVYFNRQSAMDALNFHRAIGREAFVLDTYYEKISAMSGKK